MQRKPTKYEMVLAHRLLDLDIEFMNQVILGFYIIDFIIPSKMLILEVDGASHKDKEDYDARRDDFCRECGFTVVRIKNEDVEEYNLNLIEAMPDVPDHIFRKGLSMGNALRGGKKRKKREYLPNIPDTTVKAIRIKEAVKKDRKDEILRKKLLRDKRLQLWGK